MKAARIWTFDGGGSSVISQLIIVNEIMYRIQWELKLDFIPRPCNYAELMVGTGLGGVAAIFMARLCLTAEETLVDIIELGKEVFTKTNEESEAPKFNSENLRHTATRILERRGFSGDTMMIEDVLIEGQTYGAVLTTPAVNLSSCRPLRTYSVGRPGHNPTIVEAILATMATPSWFDPVTLGPAHLRETLAGGAMGYNNPTNEGLEEAKRLFGPDQSVAIILSLGSGHKDIPSLSSSTGEDLATVLEQITMDCERIAEEVSRRLDNTSVYYRLSVDKGMNDIKITDWSESGLGTINSYTTDYNNRISSSLDVIVDFMLNQDGTVTLGQITQAAAKPITAKAAPPLTPYYVPRNNIYDAMNQALTEDNTDSEKLFVICGMAGVGKTQLSSYYERQNHEKYSYILFVDASSVSSIKAGLQSSIRSLGGSHSQDTHEDALRFLAHSDSGRWLAIFDNADDPQLPLQDYLPRSLQGAKIITTRNPGMIQLAPNSHWKLEGMADADAESVLFRAAQLPRPGTAEDEEYANRLCSALGGLPLALVQVGCYCYTSGISFKQYLDRFEQHRRKLMEAKLNLQLDQYNHSVYTSISLSFSLLDTTSQSLLRLLSFFHASNIPLDILRIASKHNFIEAIQFLEHDDGHKKLQKELGQILTPNGEWDDIYIDKLLRDLQSVSLISSATFDGMTTITMHPIIQLCTQNTLSPEERNLYLQMCIQILASYDWEEEAGIFQYLLVHIAEIEGYGAEMHVNHEAAFAYILLFTGMDEEAKERWIKVKEECCKRNGAEHWSTLYSSYMVAGCLSSLLRCEEAEVILQDVAKTQETVLGEDHEQTLFSYKKLAFVLTTQAKTKEAESIYKRILALNEKKYGSEHWKTFDIQSSLTDNLIEQGKHSEAEGLLRNILPVMKTTLGEEDEVTLSASHRLSRALINQEKWKEAKVLLEELVKRSTRTRGKEHPNTLISLHSLSTCLYNQENWSEAERIQRELLQVRERILGKEHRYTIDTRDALKETIQATQQASDTSHTNDGESLFLHPKRTQNTAYSTKDKKNKDKQALGRIHRIVDRFLKL